MPSHLASTVSDYASASATIIGTLILVIFGGGRASSSVRRQTVGSATESDQLALWDDGASPARDRALIEGFLVRFIIFYLFGSAWSAILDILSIVKPFAHIGGVDYDVGVTIVYIAIFLFLGLPLLVDIYRRYGLRGRRG